MYNILENRVLKEYYINEFFRRYIYGGSMGRKKTNRIKKGKRYENDGLRQDDG